MVECTALEMRHGCKPIGGSNPSLSASFLRMFAGPVTPAARLLATLEILAEVEASARPVDGIVSAFFRAHRRMGDRDRGAVLELVQNLLRHRARLDWWLERQGGRPTPRGRLLAFLALAQKRTPEELAELFKGADVARAIPTQKERSLIASFMGCAVEHPDMPEAVRLECPAWAEGRLRRRFGAAFSEEMAAMLRPAPLDLRVNPLKSSREAMLAALRDLGIRAEPAPLSPFGIRIEERLSLASLPMLKEGAVEIQDEGSQLVALLVDARPGERVVDFCAGAGGKTLCIAAQMNNKGHIVACDVSEGRLERGAERFRRAGLHNIQTRLLSSESDKWIKRHKGGYDRVLVDAPCSGTGTWRRNPDARWSGDGEEGLAKLVAQQARILASAARLVKPGGRLVYATCSLLPEENEGQVDAFLAANPAFRALSIAEIAPGLATSAHPVHLSLTPGHHGTDGFFAAVMQRQAAEPAKSAEPAVTS